MTQEEKKYKEALERAREAKQNTESAVTIGILEEIFPELAEGEDEKIRKELITHCKNIRCVTEEGAERKAKWIAWLEKQGQKPTDKLEPKFKVGDWITNGDYTWKVTAIQPLDYILQSQNGNTVDDTISYVDEYFHLWFIKDAKDGDVLDANGAPFIYKRHDEDYVYFYCGVNLADAFIEANGIDTWNSSNKVYPATKEQRDILFQKMHEGGYEWDAEKKELKKIEQKPVEENKGNLGGISSNWGEGDERIISKILGICEDFKRSFRISPASSEIVQKDIDKINNWLKSFKQ